MIFTPNKDELSILREGLDGPENIDYLTGYWFKKPDGSCFNFDYGFDPKYAWQKKLIFASQPLIVAVQGIGTGKTLGVGMAGFTWGMSTDGFKFLNGSNWAWQSKIMYELTLGQIVDTPAERFIFKAVETPYPKITLKWKIGKRTYTSTLEYMDMQKYAAKIFSWRGDWINLDEAALIDDLDKVLMNLSTRLTGKTASGREYLGRMSMMTNAWDNDSAAHVYYFYDLALENPKECLSISIPTHGNKNVTDRQINNTMRFIRDKEEQERLLLGERPEGKGKYFAKGRVTQAGDKYLSDYVRQRADRGDQGFSYIEYQTFGAVEYQMPKTSDEIFLVGDPGSDAFPARNAPCIGAIDASGLPYQPAVLVGFWWGNGGGHIGPFVDKFYDFKRKYQPIFSGIDSTGPQAGMVQVMNLQSFWDGQQKLTISDVNLITGLDFSVGRKQNMLLSARILIEMGLLRWADFAKGIRIQLWNYDPLLDRGGVPKIAQDIVAMLAMGAFVIRAFYAMEDSYEDQSRLEAVANRLVSSRDQRQPSEARDYRG
jgi:hypothetical protein